MIVGVINSAQFVNGLWVGTVLIAIAVVPGLFDRCTRVLSDFGNALLFRLPSLVRRPFPVRTPIPAQAGKMPWLAALGMAIVLITVYAYIAR